MANYDGATASFDGLRWSLPEGWLVANNNSDSMTLQQKTFWNGLRDLSFQTTAKQFTIDEAESWRGGLLAAFNHSMPGEKYKAVDIHAPGIEIRCLENRYPSYAASLYCRSSGNVLDVSYMGDAGGLDDAERIITSASKTK